MAFWIQILIAVVSVGLLQFHSLYRLLTFEWGKADFFYCYFMPAVICILVWMRRHEFALFPPRPSWAGLIAVFTGIFFLFLGEFGGEYLSLYLSIWFMAFGMCWVLFGWRKLNVILFPVFLMLTTFPPPRLFYVRINSALQEVSAAIVAKILYWMAVPVFQHGGVLEFSSTRFELTGTYSGLRYVIPIGIAALIITYLGRLRWWKCILVLGAAVPLALILNGLRIAMLSFSLLSTPNGMVPDWMNESLGWATFFLSSGIMIGIAKFLPGRPRAGAIQKNVPGKAHRGDEFFGSNPPSDRRTVSIPFIAAIAILAGVFGFMQYRANSPDYLPRARSFSSFPARIGAFTGERGFLTAELVEELDLTDYVQMTYNSPSGRLIDFYTAWYASQSKGQSIHTPETCMRVGNWRFQDGQECRIDLPGYVASPVRLKKTVLTNGSERWMMYFWFRCRGRNLVNAYELKLFNFLDRLMKRRSDGALIRVMTPIGGSETPTDAETRIQLFLRKALPELDMYLPD